MHIRRVLFAAATSDRVAEFPSLSYSRHLVSQTPQETTVTHVRLCKRPLPVRTYLQLIPEPTMTPLAWPPALAAVDRYPFISSPFTTGESEANQP